MISDVPNLSFTNLVASITASPVASERSPGDEAAKELAVKSLIDGSIKSNESQGVKTAVRLWDVKRDNMLVDHRKDEEHFAASINKLPVALLVIDDVNEGKWNLDQEIVWSSVDVRGGYGTYDQPGAPLKASLRDVIEDMLGKSGNTAVRVLVNYVLHGAPEVNKRLSATGKLPHTYLQPLDNGRFYLGYTSANDSLWIMKQIMKKEGEAAKISKDAMKDNIFGNFGVRSQLAGSPYLILVNKVGILNDADGNNRHDVGIIYNTEKGKAYIYSMLTTAPAGNAGATTRAEDSLKEMGHASLEYAGRSNGGHGSGEAGRSAPNALHEQSQPVAEGKILY